MRTFLVWFNDRRRLGALALLGLVAVVYLSAGRTPQSGEWIAIPDLSIVLATLLGILAIIGLVIFAFARPKASSRRTGEVRTLRALLLLAVVVGVATVWFGSPEVALEPPVAEQEQLVGPTSDDAEVGANVELPAASGTDIAMLILILLMIAAVVIRRMRASPVAPEEPITEDTLQEDLAAAVEAAHHRLIGESDPRSAVLMAYSSLERGLADIDHARDRAETPGEHMSRVLAAIPALVEPAVRLGELYEVARFSQQEITEDDCREAALALDQARFSLAHTEPAHL